MAHAKMRASTMLLALTLLVTASFAEEPCRLWLAPSHISTENSPKFGLYAGAQGFAEDETIPSYEMAVPVFDFLQGPAAQRSDLNSYAVKFLDGNMWVADYFGSRFESNFSASAFVPGIGTMVNYHSGIANVDWLQGSIVTRSPDELLQEIVGKAHPSRGTVTPYYNATLRATRTIQPGMELFANFVDNDDDTEDIYQENLTRLDYANADKVLDKIIGYMDTFGDQMSDNLKDNMLEFMLEAVLDEAASKRAKAIRSLIPDRPNKLKRVKEAGGAFAYRNRDMIKSLDWLEERGLCVDNLKVGRSTIPDAGRGAFANRAIKAEAVISPVPMLPILNEEVLELYSDTIEVTNPRGGKEYVLNDSKPPSGYQLLLNYCYGHPESSLLLLPSAPLVNMINHAPEGSKVNAFLQWSKNAYVFNDHSLHDQPIGKFDLNDLPPMVMELIALRDIEEGEEILIDYGADWAQAWYEWRQQWSERYESVSPDGERNNKWPLKAVDIRPLYKDKPFPVNLKEGQVPYSPGVASACFIEAVDDPPDGSPRYNANGHAILKWMSPTTFKYFTGQHLAVCDLLSREEVSVEGSAEKSYNYTVITRLKDAENDRLVEVRQVPHIAITLVDMPYTSDIHTPGAFRRWISLEDHRFPQMWRNMRV